MTKAAQSIVRREVSGGRVGVNGHRKYIVEVRDDVVLLRPKRSRRGGAAEVAVRWDALYIFGFVPPARKKTRRRKVARGLL